MSSHLFTQLLLTTETAQETCYGLSAFSFCQKLLVLTIIGLPLFIYDYI